MRVFFITLALIGCLGGTGWSAPEVRINIPELVLRLYDGPVLVREYGVALGTPYEPTPVGSYRVFYMEKNPTWYPGGGFTDKTPVPPGPDNPLGSRWIEFLASYGIHGTNKDWDIEYPVSGGCIRMHNADVQELYEMVAIGTPVVITYETLVLQERADALYLKVFPDIYDKRTSTPEALAELFRPYEGRYVAPGAASIPADPDKVREIRVGARVKGTR